MDVLAPRRGDACIDGTLGAGGHARELLRRIPGGILLAVDWNGEALRETAAQLERLVDTERLGVTICARHGNFRDIKEFAAACLPDGKADCVLLDLGMSSDELEGDRGMSFRKDAPLIMRYDGDTRKLTGAQVVNEYREAELRDILRTYGEERYAHRIARAIVARRKQERIYRTGDLARIVERAVPHIGGRRHPALRTFLALRVYVNEELENLKQALDALPELMKPGGRTAVISFHSLEDRIVKNCFKDYEAEGKGTLLTKKPIVPTAAEREENPRSRSAKLRVIKFAERIKGHSERD